VGATLTRPETSTADTAAIHDDIRALARSEVGAARAAQIDLLLARPVQIDAYFQAVAARLEQRAEALLAANAADLQAAEGHYSPAILDRGRMTPPRLQEMAKQQRALVGAPEVVGRTIRSWTRPNGLRFREVRHPLGVIAAVFEARYNVGADIAAQALKSRNAVVLKGGRMLVRTDTALVDEVLRPAAEAAGLPPAAIGFMRIPDRSCALAMLDERPDACIGRGDNPLITMLAHECAQRGVELIAHDKGGAWLYIDRKADPETALAMIVNSLDRRGVCNRLNVLLVHAEIAGSFLPRAIQALEGIGVTSHGTERTRPGQHKMKRLEVDLGHEWLSDNISVDIPADWREALELANRWNTGIGLAVCTADNAVARRMALLYNGTYFGINALTRFNDGFEITGRSETGIVTRNTTGARGAVTYPDLTQRKIVAVGTGHEKR
jgi:glutamate-5-semialdehyde dehydrogenase